MTSEEVRKVILEIVEKIEREYKPDKIILFGSYAYGMPHEDSDIDLLIIKDTQDRPIDRRVAVAKIVSDPKRLIPFEPIVLTPKELDERLKIGDQFLREILQKGELLMERRESLYPEDWFRVGDRDLRRAKYLLGGADLEGAAFNTQQAIEKYLKGYLLSKGWELRKIHDLEILINEAIRYDPSFEEFKTACRKITQYYVEDRYPFITASELTEDEIRESLTSAENIVAKIKGLV